MESNDAKIGPKVEKMDALVLNTSALGLVEMIKSRARQRDEMEVFWWLESAFYRLAAEGNHPSKPATVHIIARIQGPQEKRLHTS